MLYVCKKRDDKTLAILDTESAKIEDYSVERVINLVFKDKIRIEGVSRKPGGKVLIQVMRATDYEVVEEIINSEDTSVLENVANELAERLNLTSGGVASDKNGCYIQLSSFESRNATIYVCPEDDAITIQMLGQQDKTPVYRNGSWVIDDAYLSSLREALGTSRDNEVVTPLASSQVEQSSYTEPVEVPVEETVEETVTETVSTPVVVQAVSDDISSSDIFKVINELEALSAREDFMGFNYSEVSYTIDINPGTAGSIQRFESIADLRTYANRNIDFIEGKKLTKLNLKLRSNDENYEENFDFDYENKSLKVSFSYADSVINTKTVKDFESIPEAILMMHEAKMRYKLMKLTDDISGKTQVKHTSIEKNDVPTLSGISYNANFNCDKFQASVSALANDDIIYRVYDGEKDLYFGEEKDFVDMLNMIKIATEISSNTGVQFECSASAPELICVGTKFSIKVLPKDGKIHFVIGTKDLELPKQINVANTEMSKVFDLMDQQKTATQGNELSCYNLIDFSGGEYWNVLSNGNRLTVK